MKKENQVKSEIRKPSVMDILKSKSYLQATDDVKKYGYRYSK